MFAKDNLEKYWGSMTVVFPVQYDLTVEVLTGSKKRISEDIIAIKK